MLDVYADEITFEGRPVAKFLPNVLPGFRIAAEQALTSVPDGYVKDEDHQKALDEMEKEAFNNGKAEGEAEGHRLAKDEFEKKIEKISEAAFNEGRSDALCAADRAADVARVDKLIAALKRAEALLFVGKAGVRQPNGYRNRPAKLSECKRAMADAQWALRGALIDYDSPNGAEESRHDPPSIRPPRLRRARAIRRRLRPGAAVNPAALDILVHVGAIAFLLFLNLV